MKKVSLIVFVLIASFFLSCSSTSTLKVSRDQMKSYKKIFITPLYVPDQMIQKDYKDNDADLVLFHYLQCAKHSAFVEGGWGYKKYGPYDSLRYYGKIYDKNGNIVFDTIGEKDTIIALIMEYYKDRVIFGTLKVRPTLEKLKEQLTEKNINFNLGYNNYDEKAYYGEFVVK